MPQYLFQHPKTLDIKEVFQSVHTEHVHEEDGVKWNRIFTAPQMSVDTKLNSLDSKDFLRKTASAKGTLGDLFDRAKDMSSERERVTGRDEVKETYYKDWSKSRRNKIHPDKRQEKLQKNLPKGIEVEL